MTPGLIIAAPASGSGKTALTLGLLRHFTASGVAVASAKVGPDYIDPAFHAAATRRACINLDGWAMRPETVAGLAGGLAEQAELIVCEGVMGLFDGANVPPGEPDGSTADLAALTGWPVVLVVDVRGQAASAAALINGFVRHRPDVRVAGVIFNKVGSPAHRDILTRACARFCPGLPLLGFVPRDGALEMPSRHLGLVQAREHGGLEAFLDGAAALAARHIDCRALAALAMPGPAPAPRPVPVPPLGQHIAIARDDAFAFAYAATLEGWRAAGAELSLFSPLADQAPDGRADAVYLPGGYPELHGGRLAANAAFLEGVRAAARRGAVVFGECGGYMTLGQSLTDAEGRTHAMLGLLPLETSIAKPRLHLGYRRAELAAALPWAAAGSRWRAHEFHYASITAEGDAQPLFSVADAALRPLGMAGLTAGCVAGSFIHLIDRA